MSAVIVEFSEFVTRRRLLTGATAALTVAAVEAIDVSKATATEAQFCFWRGASGDRYVHHIYDLIACPELPAANYVLVGRDTAGRRKVLQVGRAKHATPSLNLAEIRYLGAKLGASEVHVHLLAETDGQRRLVDMDLHSGLFASQDSVSLSA